MMAIKTVYILSIFLLLHFFGYAQTKMDRTGKEIFIKKCSTCHGPDGTKGRWGAKNLQLSKLGDDELIRIISAGKNIMPSWKRRLSGEELARVAAYVKTLRK